MKHRHLFGYLNTKLADVSTDNELHKIVWQSTNILNMYYIKAYFFRLWKKKFPLISIKKRNNSKDTDKPWFFFLVTFSYSILYHRFFVPFASHVPTQYFLVILYNFACVQGTDTK